MEETALKIFIAVAGTLITALLIGGVKLRDMVLKQERECKWINDDFKDLKNIYEKDKVERSSLLTMATSIDTKIDAKLKDVLSEIAEQRRQDTAMFTKAVSDLDKTLGKFDVTLMHLRGDIDAIKNNK